MMEERWADIPFTNGIYSVSDQGNVRKNTTGKLVSAWDRKGYKAVTLNVDGKRHKLSLHVLIAEAFVPNPRKDDPKVCIVNHIDENRSNNELSNLEWCTLSENVNHSKHKTSGDNHWTKRRAAC